MDKDPTKPDKEKYHDKQRGTDKLYGYSWVGQNWASITGKDVSQAVSQNIVNWYDEV